MPGLNLPRLGTQKCPQEFKSFQSFQLIEWNEAIESIESFQLIEWNEANESIEAVYDIHLSNHFDSFQSLRIKLHNQMVCGYMFLELDL